MKALVFAAGLGTRLRPLTDHKPKALVELCGVTMLERVITNIKSWGITDVVVNVHHFGDQIIDFLKDKDNFGINITISDERDLLLDTGGGILKARHLLEGDEPFLVHNADILTDLNLAEMIAYHKANGADVTLLAKQRSTQRYLVFGENNQMVGWTNIATGEVKPADLVVKQENSLLAFGGVHVISPRIFDSLARFATEPKFSIMQYYIAACRDINIAGYNPDGYNWFDIGKIETLQKAELFLQCQNQ